MWPRSAGAVPVGARGVEHGHARLRRGGDRREGARLVAILVSGEAHATETDSRLRVRNPGHCRHSGLREESDLPVRVPLVALVLALAGLLVVDLEPSAAPNRASAPAQTRPKPKPKPDTVDVAFVRNGWVVRVERVVPKGVVPALHALRELVQGPTRLERRQGIRTALPDSARIRSLRARPDLWLASFSRSTLGAGSAETRRTRLWQIAATLAPLGPQEDAAIATEGRLVTTLRLGVRPGEWRAETGENDYRYVVRGLQLRLAALGYLDESDVSGSLDYLTEQALMAFQGWEDLDRTGTVTGQTQLALFDATRPKPASAPGGSPDRDLP